MRIQSILWTCSLVHELQNRFRLHQTSSELLPGTLPCSRLFPSATVCKYYGRACRHGYLCRDIDCSSLHPALTRSLPRCQASNIHGWKSDAGDSLVEQRCLHIIASAPSTRESSIPTGFMAFDYCIGCLTQFWRTPTQKNAGLRHVLLSGIMA